MVNLLQNDSKPVFIERARLGEVPTPRATLSWCPLPHVTLMTRMEEKINTHGYRIHHSECILTHDGNRFFGTATLASRSNLGYRRMVGVRNSHDKSHAAGLLAGARVIVCANGMFSGDEICLSRKHTSRMLDDLDERIEEGFKRVFSEWENNDLRIARYRESLLNPSQAHDLVIRCMDNQVLPPSSIPKVLQEWRQPWHEEFVPRNAWSLFNGFTEVLKRKPHLIPERTKILHRVFDQSLGIA